MNRDESLVVIANRDEVEGNDPVMTVEYKTEEWDPDYDIINNPEEFNLYVDGELIENQKFKK